jgi:glycosyltransferase involved in cell wall biosynthesis
LRRTVCGGARKPGPDTVNPSALYICYYNVAEPLVQTQVLAYVRELARRGYAMHLLTFEMTRPSREAAETTRRALAADGIRWHWLRYHKRPSLPATLYDIAVGTLVACGICLRHRIRLVHARSHVPATMALVLKRLLRRTFLFDFRGQLAEEYADAGHWSRTGAAYRLTRRMEHCLLRSADGIVVLTDRMRARLLEEARVSPERRDNVVVIPCCVDTQIYRDCSALGQRYRQERGWSDRRILLYLGKLSERYMPGELARFAAWAIRSDPSYFFQIVTQGDPRLLLARLVELGVDARSYDVRRVSPQEVPTVLAAANATLSFIGGDVSRRAVSPTKFGESLACGVPVVSSAGVGDLDSVIQQNRLGVVVRDFTDEGIRRSLVELEGLIADGDLASRCREYVQRELSLAEVGGPRYARLYSQLRGEGRHAQPEG